MSDILAQAFMVSWTWNLITFLNSDPTVKKTNSNEKQGAPTWSTRQAPTGLDQSGARFFYYFLLQLLSELNKNLIYGPYSYLSLCSNFVKSTNSPYNLKLQGLVTLYCRITKLGWFDSEKDDFIFRNVMDDVNKFLSGKLIGVLVVYLQFRQRYVNIYPLL